MASMVVNSVDVDFYFDCRLLFVFIGNLTRTYFEIEKNREIQIEACIKRKKQGSEVSFPGKQKMEIFILEWLHTAFGCKRKTRTFQQAICF